ncbi:MAG TPA: type VI secretion system baseplate subunit TssG [Candidatus Binataceae bacterium]|nr:type VI secretion system baseplate subunit TssG [Candidatus Binataceae bacterium]
MAGSNGRLDASLSERLDQQPYRFDIRQAVRLLELMAPADSVAVGAGSDPRREAVRLRSSLSSNFPPSDIESLDRTDGEPQPTLTLTVLGLAGAFGPLPPPLSARVIERERVKDHSARDFLDLFNHRLLALLLRLDKLFSPPLQIASAKDVASADTPASVPLLALLGLATLSPAQVEAHLGAIAASLIGAAGLLNPKPFSAHALERLIGAHFGLPVRVLPLSGGWLSLAADQYTRLGRSGRLAQSAVLGKRIWDQAAGICLEIGPTDRETFLKFLPDGPKHEELAGLVAFALGDAFEVEMRVMLRPPDVPPGALGQPRPRLGWTSWLGQAPWQLPAPIHLRLTTRRAAQD